MNIPVSVVDECVLYSGPIRQCGEATATRPAPLFGVGNLPAPLPEVQGRLRIRLRNDDFALAFHRTKDGIVEYALCIDVNGALCLAYPQGANLKA